MSQVAVHGENNPIKDRNVPWQVKSADHKRTFQTQTIDIKVCFRKIVLQTDIALTFVIFKLINCNFAV